MKKQFGWICMVAGLLCILAALCLICFNRSEDEEAGTQAKEAVPYIVAQMPETDLLPEEPMAVETGDMPAIEVDGHSYIGMITIPVLDLELPIQAEWSQEAAKISPCRYKGSVYDQDLIVAGRNYTRHFGKLKQLNNGDEVIITDVNGRSYFYSVTYMETIDTYGIEEMDAGEWDLTVFTRTLGGAGRVTVRCEFTGETANYKELNF